MPLATGVVSKPLDPPSGKKFAPMVRVKAEVTGRIHSDQPAGSSPQMVV